MNDAGSVVTPNVNIDEIVRAVARVLQTQQSGSSTTPGILYAYEGHKWTKHSAELAVSEERELINPHVHGKKSVLVGCALVGSYC